MTKRKIKKDNNGFGLIEVLVGMVILAFIMMAAHELFTDALSQNTSMAETLAAQTRSRRAIKAISSELRGAVQSANGSYPLSQTGTSSLIFFANVDTDSQIERIRYFLDGDILKKGITEATGSPIAYNPADEAIAELASGIAPTAEPIFQYFDASYDGTTPALPQPVDISSVRLVKILIPIDENPHSPPGPVFAETQVMLRNLKDNL